MQSKILLGLSGEFFLNLGLMLSLGITLIYKFFSLSYRRFGSIVFKFPFFSFLNVFCLLGTDKQTLIGYNLRLDPFLYFLNELKAFN